MWNNLTHQFDDKQIDWTYMFDILRSAQFLTSELFLCTIWKCFRGDLKLFCDPLVEDHYTKEYETLHETTQFLDACEFAVVMFWLHVPLLQNNGEYIAIFNFMQWRFSALLSLFKSLAWPRIASDLNLWCIPPSPSLVLLAGVAYDLSTLPFDSHNGLCSATHPINWDWDLPVAGYCRMG